MALKTLRYKPPVRASDLIVSQHGNEIRSMPAGFSMEEIELGVYPDKIEIHFLYLIPETERKMTVKGFPDINVLVGKYTGKILKLSIHFSSVEDAETKLGVARKALDGIKNSIIPVSVKRTYDFAVEFIEGIKPNLIAKLPDLLTKLKDDAVANE